MQCLLDTHTLIWYFEHDGKLTSCAEETIDNPENAVYVSVISLWEIAIKKGLGKLDVDFDRLLAQVEQAGFPIVQIKNAYLRKQIDLPQIHKDPFDRLLVATAEIENMALITADENIHTYAVEWIW
jgi:PIN domain nuclease of toxin-antitoxin system